MGPKHVHLADVTLDRVLGARAVRASDGCVSRLIWENPESGATTDDLFIRVRQVTPECVDRVREKVCLLLDSAAQPLGGASPMAREDPAQACWG